jgi:GNAT superfamily N-acetyltransferase
MAEWQIESLSSIHDRQSFCCGKPSLDDFIRKLATQYDRRDMGRTYVAVTSSDPALIAGYYTLASGSVAFASLPDDIRRKLPRHPIPVAHLGRLAVDAKARGQRLGETLLMDALQRCHRLSKEIGIFGVEVFALDEEARHFYLKYDFTALVNDQRHLYLSMRKIRQLFEA